MLVISLVFSLVMLALVNVRVCRSERVGSAAWVAWAFLPLGFCPWCAAFPTYLLNVVLVGVLGLVCMAYTAPRRVFVVWSLVATLASYGVGAYFAIEHVREEANLYPYESLEERLSYENRRDELPRRLGLTSSGETAAAFDETRLVEIDDAIERDEFHPRFSFPGNTRSRALEEMHEHHLAQFVRSPSFGVARIFFPRYAARPPQQETLPMSYLTSSARENSQDHKRPAADLGKSTGELGWLLHRDSIADFLNPSRFGYARDRGHVAGFQAHQFTSYHGEQAQQQYQLRRLELVSLLKYEQPGVYLTENLPRMDELRDVPIRALDDFERDNLKHLWHGDDLAAEQQGDGLRMLGAIRAGKQCLSCHEARRGDLLGAFSYHLDPMR